MFLPTHKIYRYISRRNWQTSPQCSASVALIMWSLDIFFFAVLHNQSLKFWLFMEAMKMKFHFPVPDRDSLPSSSAPTSQRLHCFPEWQEIHKSTLLHVPYSVSTQISDQPREKWEKKNTTFLGSASHFCRLIELNEIVFQPFLRNNNLLKLGKNYLVVKMTNDEQIRRPESCVVVVT